GTARSAQWKAERSGLFSAERMVHPLPEGSPRERAGVRGNRPPHGAARMSSTCRATDAFRAIWLCTVHDFKPPALPKVSDVNLARSEGVSNTSGATTNAGRRPFIKSTIACAAVVLTRSPVSRAHDARCGVSSTFGA